MFQIDDALIHSIISLGRRSRDSLHFEVQRTDQNAEDTFEAHFAQLWNNSRTYDQWRKDYASELDELQQRFPTWAGGESTAKKQRRRVVSPSRPPKRQKRKPRKSARSGEA